MLIAATNPCPCGYAGSAERCRVTQGDRARDRRKVSGPLRDRIDLLAHLPYDGVYEPGAAPVTSSKTARERVLQARERQSVRLADAVVGQPHGLNARML